MSYLDVVSYKQVLPEADSNITFTDAEMDFLITSIQETGIDTPLQVVEKSEGFVLLDGRKRLYAARVLGIDMLPVEVI